MHGRRAGDIRRRLGNSDDPKFKKIAEIIQRVRPDVILLNEFDFDATGDSIKQFQKNYLDQSQNKQQPIAFRYSFSAPVNTGVDSRLDLDGNGKLGEGNDAFGFGMYPGQYGMVVLSRFPIDRDNARTFQKFLWGDMPNALWPIHPETGKQYYSDRAKKVFRLSSKSHWDLPIKLGDDLTVHFLASHPTPPVFDGPEDRNGKRNHDEIRFWSDYVSGKGEYIYDDVGKKGGLPGGSHFVIAGDQNADPWDGDSFDGAINQLLKNGSVRADLAPGSLGGGHYARVQGGQNKFHKSPPENDTADFNENVGNVRVDYCLPSRTLDLKSSGVFWPKPDQPGGDLVDASDHRLVWIDIVGQPK